LKLADFRRQQNPGRAGNASFSSDVQVVDEACRVDQQHHIAMNEPLTHRRFTFYQSSFKDDGHGHEASVFSVAYDPGRLLKYAGSLMICLGIAIMFYMRAYFFKKPRRQSAPRAMTSFAAEPAHNRDSKADVPAVPAPLSKSSGLWRGQKVALARETQYRSEQQDGRQND
jgi:hypothetical protein